MSTNRILFQPGLSMPEFLKQFGTEAQCEAELEQVRGPKALFVSAVPTRVIVCLKLDRTKHFSARVGDIADCGNSLPKHQVAADGLVPGDLPHQPSQDWPVRAGPEALSGRQLSHCMPHSAQAHGSHVQARNELHPQRPCPSR